MDFSFSDLNFNSVETLPGFEARAAFTVNSSSVFREDVDIVPTIVDDTLSYIPWGGDNLMPFDLLALVEKDETLATCQCFNAEVCYGSGLQYCATEASASVKSAVEDFLLDNDLAAYFLGICQDFKHFGFAVSVLILNEDGSRIVRLLRKEACYCRFTPADKHGRISKILYANWRKPISARADIEEIDLLDPTSPWRDLQDKLAKKSKCRKFAIVSRIPTVDSTYYPIPYYGALFRGKWYNIKQLIGIAKEAKLKNTMNGFSTLKKLTDDYLLLQVTDRSTVEMKLLPLVNNTYVVCMITTVYGPVPDSQVEFFTTDWKPLDAADLYTPVSAEWFIKDDADKSRIAFIEATTRLDMDLRKYSLSPDNQMLTEEYTTPQSLSEAERKRVEPFLKNEPKVYTWEKFHFK